jgi:hypothetical protein
LTAVEETDAKPFGGRRFLHDNYFRQFGREQFGLAQKSNLKYIRLLLDRMNWASAEQLAACTSLT